MAFGGDGRGGPRIKIKWPVTVKTAKGSMDGVTLDLGTDGAFVLCANPLRLNEVFDIVINAPDQPIEAKAEVIWSNIYGPNDDITPRGMGVRFIEISGAHRRVIAEVALEHLKSEKVDPRELEALQTLVIELDELPPK
ncbi:MAG: PilZ domain-containing protein [Syntrophobacterales bacterium]|jgi:c-di-GMP-binding flagellar brake protein YcgR